MPQSSATRPSSAIPVSVLGAGSWGPALATLACRRSPSLIWARNPDRALEITDPQTLAHYLPGVRLPDELQATADLSEAIGRVCAEASQPGLTTVVLPVAGTVSI